MYKSSINYIQWCTHLDKKKKKQYLNCRRNVKVNGDYLITEYGDDWCLWNQSTGMMHIVKLMKVIETISYND